MQVSVISATSFAHHPKYPRQCCQLARLWQVCFVVPVDFLPRGVTINARYYSNLLRNDVRQAIRMKRPRKLSKKVILLLHDTSRPNTADLMTSATVALEMVNHFAYNHERLFFISWGGGETLCT
jgi:hypothetical protein